LQSRRPPIPVFQLPLQYRSLKSILSFFEEWTTTVIAKLQWNRLLPWWLRSTPDLRDRPGTCPGRPNFFPSCRSPVQGLKHQIECNQQGLFFPKFAHDVTQVLQGKEDAPKTRFCVTKVDQTNTRWVCVCV
jgi:hypothetical protein